MPESSHFIKIKSLVYGGYGFARLPNEKAAFVPFVLPDEEVRIQITEEKKGFVFADVVDIEERNPIRIAHRCAHFGTCGGCHYQHMSYHHQLEFKQDILLEQFKRIGKVEPEKIGTCIQSNDEWGYRNVMQFHLDKAGRLCFNDRNNHLFPIEECHLPMPAIRELWPQVDFGEGLSIDRLEFRQNCEGDILINLYSPIRQVPEILAEMPISIIHHTDQDTLVLAGDDHLIFELGEKVFQVQASSFFQTNLGVAEQLALKVREIVQSHACRSVVDTFCGVGLFSAFLTDISDQIIGIESSLSACDDYILNLDKSDNTTLYQGRAEIVLPELKEKIDCVIIDPPRSGLQKELTRGLEELKPDLIIYVSCNPATLARDSRHLLKSGYQLIETILVDMFPQTFHIESINTFVRV